MSNVCYICQKIIPKPLECAVCGHEVCPSCSEQCSICKQWICFRHLICVYKKEHICTECYANQLMNSVD